MKLHFFSSWDSKIDDLLLSNKVTLNLLYIQTVSDVELNWVQGTQETEKQLARMQVNFWSVGLSIELNFLISIFVTYV